MKFQKGQSGNPGGRPKEAAEVKELARQYGPAAIELLAEIMSGEHKQMRVPLRDRIEAAKALLDRGYGRPPQQIAVDATLRDARMDSEPMSSEEWDRHYGRASAPN